MRKTCGGLTPPESNLKHPLTCDSKVRTAGAVTLSPAERNAETQRRDILDQQSNAQDSKARYHRLNYIHKPDQ
ncbi:uncharacterized protein BDV17DRAFT_219613 [Aspergillus undulatus]|uniref:uncharacterized protein n=1 Tax=Aspergillus undulatus TaxID=1810928 RepID=UPI003CCD37F5